MIQILRRLTVVWVLLLINSPVIVAADAHNEQESVIDVVGKVSNHDYFELPLGNKLYLPRIFLAGGEWYFFTSTKKAVESGMFMESEAGLVQVDGSPISLDMSISSHLIYVWFGFILTFLITLWASRRYKRGIGTKTEPRGAWQNIFEVLFVFIRDDIAREFIPHDKYKKFVPYLFTIFMAIAFMNLFGLLPWAAAATANLTVTATLAMITFVLTQVNGSRDHWEHVFMFPGVPGWSRFILTPVEFLGLFTKPFALAIRLFANMLSGKIMIVSILGLIFIFTDLFGAVIGVGSGIFWVLLTAALYFLKALVALIQAYVFTLLSAVFIGMAAEEHHHEHDETSVAHAQDVQL
ncbi:MAG: ATP synthase F0 subunit A [Balneolaceae bacterium]|jgi:F-type H+-transporting ATPase subunit a|nr:MAG: ATP synthase F0 subunit A [Balneolaceae bacterium]